jgi:hypothetical protein
MLVFLFLLNFMIWYVGYVYIELTHRIYIYIYCGLYEVLNYELWWLIEGLELWDLVMMSWLSKLIVVDNLRYPKYKWNSAEFLIDLKKKHYPQIKRICWDLLTLIKSYDRARYSWYQSPGIGPGKNSKEFVDVY